MDSATKHIAFAFDNNYLQQAFTLVESIVSTTNNCFFHCIIDENVAENEISRLQRYIEQREHAFQRYSVEAKTVAHFVRSGTWSHAVYYKLYFPLLVEEHISRLLYIDTDTLVLNDLSPLYNTNLSEFALGAVYDCYVKTQEKIGITNPGQYFNSGMLLFDLPKWKKAQYSERAIAYLNDHPEHILFVDQCALNAVVQGDYLQLNPKNNFLFSYLSPEISRSEMEQLKKEVILVHFTLDRPWFTMCKNYFRSEYRFYFKQSPLTTGNYRIDFAASRLLPLFKQRVFEWYLRNPFVKKLWRTIKPASV